MAKIRSTGKISRRGLYTPKPSGDLLSYSLGKKKSNTGTKGFAQWQELVSKCPLNSKRAIDLYSGPLWKSYLDSWELLNSSDFKSHLWILSAGYGFIGGDEKIKPYDITFQGGGVGVPSVLTKFSNDHGTNK